MIFGLVFLKTSKIKYLECKENLHTPPMRIISGERGES